MPEVLIINGQYFTAESEIVEKSVESLLKTFLLKQVF